MRFTDDELLFLELIHEENFQRDYDEWIEFMEADNS